MVAYSLRLSSAVLVYKLKTEFVSPIQYKINNDSGVPDATMMLK
jgi:hypothetical protein